MNSKTNDGSLPVSTTIRPCRGFSALISPVVTRHAAPKQPRPPALYLSGGLVDTYLASIPQDPGMGTAANTDYYLNKSASGRITISACDPENATSVSVAR